MSVQQIVPGEPGSESQCPNALLRGSLTPTWLANTCVAPAKVRSISNDRLRLAYFFERGAAVLILLALTPFLLVIAAVIVVLSRSSPLIRHSRVGWRGRPLPMLKFRTMWAPSSSSDFCICEDVSGPPIGAKNIPDARVTSRFAVFCRRYSIDELPQLYHVARGEMSLVGPRPITRTELDAHYPNCTEEVLALRPGMTGLWQVMGRSDLTYSARRRLDRIFVRNASLSLYVSVLLRSVPCVLRGKGAY
jgi:lipopolysaccharide/colanic/teichoic acid biosynthesis glycosyltransferase